MKKNVIIYCRVSTDKQSKNWESLDVQEQECRNFCKRNDYQVMSVFSEQFTWTKDKRPKIEEALEFIKNSELKISHIIVLKIDRVSRWWIAIHDSFKKQFMDLWVSLKDVYWIIGEDKNVVEVEWINTDKYNWAKSNTNQIAENMTVMMSENERNTILQRMLWQAIKNNKRWYKVRNSDYWFKNKRVMTPHWKKTIQVENLQESIYIKKMFELKARWDLSDKEITDKINLMWYTSRQRDKWNLAKTDVIWTVWWVKLFSEQLQRYIKSTVYAWIICEEWTWNKAIKTPYSWLVSIDLWNKANRWKYQINIISDNEILIEYYRWETQLEKPIIQRPKNYNPEYPYVKVIECPECWWYLTAEKSRSRNWKYHHYYACRWKKGAKHRNYSLKREEIHSKIVELFSKLNFTKEWLAVFNFISEKIYNGRKFESLEENKDIENSITQLETKKDFIASNVSKLINFPDLLEAQNKEIQEIKKSITSLHLKKKDKWNNLSLERFKKCSQKVLTHLDKLVLQRENPEVIQLVFDIVFGWNIRSEILSSHTPINNHFLALNALKKPGQECNLNQASTLNDEWWETSKNHHTLENWIIKLFDKIDKWQYVIDKIKN